MTEQTKGWLGLLFTVAGVLLFIFLTDIGLGWVFWIGFVILMGWVFEVGSLFRSRAP